MSDRLITCDEKEGLKPILALDSESDSRPDAAVIANRACLLALAAYEEIMRSFLLAFLYLGLADFFSVTEAQPLTSPVSVPLINTRDHLLIKVALGTNPRVYPYVFDTGSVLFATALGKGPSWTGATFKQSPPGNTFRTAYGSGALSYSGKIGTTTLAFPRFDDDRSRFTVDNATVGIITRPPELYPRWDADIDAYPARAPERARTFGTFGAGLFPGKGTTGSFGSVLGQIPVAGGLDQGFIVHTGGVDSESARLMVGISREEFDRFPILVHMQASTGSGTSATGQSVRFYPENQLRGTIVLVNPRGRTYEARVLVITDSGGLGLHLVHTRAGPNEFNPPDEFINRYGNLRDGIRFSLILPGAEGRRGLDWSFITGQRLYVDKVHIDRGPDGGAVGSFNTGIALFHRFDVMFDLTRGVMGFRPL